MKSQPGKQTIAIHILPNVSRSKGNQTIKIGQLKAQSWKLYNKKYMMASTHK